MNVTLRAPQAIVTVRALNGLSQSAAVRVPAIVRHYGQLYETRVKAAASGRPGPRVITGDYRRSITLEMTALNGLAAAVVGTVAPQGRRLEFGFVGTDALGRSYHQPPYAHFGPPLEPTAQEMEAALLAMVELDDRLVAATIASQVA